MQTLKIESTTYTLASFERAMAVQAIASKITGKHKPVRPKGGTGRSYPRFGASLSTSDYVRDYYAMNAPGVYCPVSGDPKKALEAGNAALDMFEPLSKHVSVPVGEDSMEVEQ